MYFDFDIYLSTIYFEAATNPVKLEEKLSMLSFTPIRHLP
jgi:hypothetical protein